jgi:hypothetical protein
MEAFCAATVHAPNHLHGTNHITSHHIIINITKSFDQNKVGPITASEWRWMNPITWLDFDTWSLLHFRCKSKLFLLKKMKEDAIPQSELCFSLGFLLENFYTSCFYYLGSRKWCQNIVSDIMISSTTSEPIVGGPIKRKTLIYQNYLVGVFKIIHVSC